MPCFKVAHIFEQGQDMIIFPLDSAIHNKPDSEKEDILSELQMRARAAGLAGRAVIMWQHGRHSHFMGPRAWQPFLRGLSIHQVHASLNREIRW